MVSEYVNDKKCILYYLKEYLDSKGPELKDKVVVDIPAGLGATTEILDNLGAKVIPFDLFPEYFKYDKVKCLRANATERLPMEDAQADMLICQEGIEHFSDQLNVIKEFNRVIKPGGQLIITTPSYSNLAAKWSYLLFESETSKHMPPNEIDDIWMSKTTLSKDIYHGHIFMIGQQKLRTLGKLAGFKVKEVRYVRISKGSVILLTIFFPFIYLNSLFNYKRHLRKDKGVSMDKKKKVYKEQFALNINLRQLINNHTFIIFEKETDVESIRYSDENFVEFDSERLYQSG